MFEREMNPKLTLEIGTVVPMPSGPATVESINYGQVRMVKGTIIFFAPKWMVQEYLEAVKKVRK